MTAADPRRLRLGILAVVVGSLFAVLLARMWSLQVLSSEESRLATGRNAVRTVVEPAPRGRILSRDGVVLVDNRPSAVVAVDRSVLDGDGEAAVLRRLERLLDVPVDVLAERLADPTADPLLPVPVAEDVGDEVVIRLREEQDGLPGVVVDRVARRTFPEGALAAHLLGHVGQISASQLEARAGEGYVAGDVIGRSGVELAFEEDLRGQDGRTTVEVDAAGRSVRVVASEPARPGADVVLSIDAGVQRVVERSLADGLAAARGQLFADDRTPLVADAGAAVVLDVDDGTVVAIASYPTFDPAVFTDGLSSAELDAFADPAAGTPQLDRAVAGLYAPGSTWKPVTAAAALRTGTIDAATTVDDQGTFAIPGCVSGCTRQNAGGTAYGPVDVRRALAVSSDVFFYGVGSDLWSRRGDLGPTPVQDLAAELGFGAPTGIALTGEQAGSVPTPAARASRHEEDPAAVASGDWFVGDDVNLAIGQGEVTVTPIQLANAYATLSNGGTRFRPGVALRVQEADGTLRRRVEPSVAATVPLAPEVLAPVVDGLRDALLLPDGTGTSAFAGFPLDRHPVAGKTGTAQAPPRQDTALFAAVAPLPDPRHAVAVVMEQAGFGSTSAAPVARAILGQLSGLEQPGPVAPVDGRPD